MNTSTSTKRSIQVSRFLFFLFKQLIDIYSEIMHNHIEIVHDYFEFKFIKWHFRPGFLLQHSKHEQNAASIKR